MKIRGWRQKIGKNWWRIHVVTPDELRTSAVGARCRMKSLGGLCLYEERRILISSELTTPQLHSVLLHEILHGTNPKMRHAAIYKIQDAFQGALERL